MMPIHHRLLLGLLVGLMVLVVVAGSFLYFFSQALLLRQFDAGVTAKAQAISSLIKRQPDGQPEIEFSAESMPEFGPNGHLDFFQVWRADGSLLARSPSLGKEELPCLTGDEYPVFRDIRLPSRRSGRAVAFPVVPAIDEDDGHQDEPPRQRADNDKAQAVHLVIAQERSDLDRTMAVLLSALFGTAVLMALGIAAVVTMVVRQGLRPLEQVAEEAAHIDAKSLSFRFSVGRLPRELQPICLRLNESLQRLEGAFQRERRFTADVAHELRTPIAELRSLADVALTWQGDAETSLAYFKDAQEIAKQMESVVTTLLALARCQSESMAIEAQGIMLRAAIQEAWACFEGLAADKQLRVTCDVPVSLALSTDRTVLLSILGNLFSNAVQYTPPCGAIAYSADCRDGVMKFNVTNECDGLACEDLPHLFEAFWRKDPARTDGSHCGLGLALVAAYAKILGGRVQATMPANRALNIEVSLPCG